MSRSARANLKSWILEASADEPIEAVVIGQMGWGDDYNSEDVPRYGEQPKGIVLSWDEAELWVDYDFDDGHGAPGCNAIWAWTASRVIFISQYDGSTRVEWVPRSPVVGEPEMPGG